MIPVGSCGPLPAEVWLIKKSPTNLAGLSDDFKSYCKTTTIVLEADFPVSVIL